MQIQETKFKVLIKPNSKKNEIMGFDLSKKAYIIHIKEPAEDNKANKELIRFLSKELGEKVAIKSGLRSKEKILEVKFK